MTMAKEAAKTAEEIPSKKRRLATFLTIFFLGIAGFVGFDGYINRWGVVKEFLNWNSLELHFSNGSSRKLKAGKDFTVERIENVQTVINPDSLVPLDRPYREQGLYRLYFRMSDSSTAKINRLYETLYRFDTTGQMTKQLEDVKLAYQRLRKVLHLDSLSQHDTLASLPSDSQKFTASTNLSFGSDQNVKAAFNRLLKNPHVLVGLGIGAAASFGIGLLEGDAYVAFAPSDAFGFDSLVVGPTAGLWEGKSIDILWTLTPRDTTRAADPSQAHR
jgi:hypothetical protein